LPNAKKALTMTPRAENNAAVRSNNTPQSPNKFDWLLKLIHHPNNTTTPPEFRDKVLAVAPMVDQSDLPFRLLCRRHGANLAFSPMIHTKNFCLKPAYQKQFFNLWKGTPKEDRPLIVQLCGSDPQQVLEVATQIQPFCDGIDLNCGCPQMIAKRGQYGAFLLEQPHVLIPLVREMCSTLTVPVSVKVRLLPSGVKDSLELYKQLQEAGASMLTIHGRNRFQKAELTGHADWSAIRQAVDFLDIPILANGSMSSLEEIRNCLQQTNAAGVMCSEALLEYPPIYTECTSPQGIRLGPSRLQLAREYLTLARQYPPEQGGQGSGQKCIRAHLHRFLHADMQDYTEIRELCMQVEDFEIIVNRLQEIYQENNHSVEDEQLSWYIRHRVVVDAKTGKTSIQERLEREASLRRSELMDDAGECMGCLFEGGDY
jgi:tRNA-dihydrouridine synthase 1